MQNDPANAVSIRCRECGSAAMIRAPNPTPDSPVTCADCGARVGSHADFVAMAESEAEKAIRQALGPG